MVCYANGGHQDGVGVCVCVCVLCLECSCQGQVYIAVANEALSGAAVPPFWAY